MLRAFARLLLRICFSRRTLKIACLLLLVAGATILIADRVMVNASKQLTWSDVNAVPARNVGLLLGARPGNRYFTRRIDTAAALYHAGKVKWLLVSGDNGRKNYDEASGMQQALIAKGVPAKVIFCDYAGFSTLDSVVRAKKVFGENHITIISQEFHNQRAIWLAKQYAYRYILVISPAFRHAGVWPDTYCDRQALVIFPQRRAQWSSRNQCLMSWWSDGHYEDQTGD